MRALVTHARRLRWLTAQSEDPMWMVRYAKKSAVQPDPLIGELEAFRVAPRLTRGRLVEVSRLDVYRDKRDFRSTPEPRGPVASRRSQRPRFVIQQHDARTMHWDLRLEADGVLKSWAVPKGPSTDPREKRLATQVEDHPVDYLDFEGVIPPGEYGAGPVIVWDAGTYGNLTTDDGEEIPVGDAIDNGHVSVWLEGRKLRGGFALTRFRGERGWLLVKMDDEAADARRNPTSTQPESVLTGRTVAQVAEEEAGHDGEAGTR